MLNFIYRPAIRRAYAQFLARAMLNVIFIPLVATAQSSDRDPLDSHTATPSAPYQSAFSDYKSYQDPELMPWRVANDTVREFGSMAQMEGMDGSKAMESTGAGGPQDKAGQENRPAEPAHDMGKMNEKNLPASPKNPAAPGGKPSEMGTMPGHDMSKMNGAPKANKTKATPDTDMEGMEGMANMPGHDMGSMKGKAAPTPPAKQPAPVTQPAAPQAMPDHSGMQKQ